MLSVTFGEKSADSEVVGLVCLTVALICPAVAIFYTGNPQSCHLIYRYTIQLSSSTEVNHTVTIFYTGKKPHSCHHLHR
jgi:hypothetical protein